MKNNNKNRGYRIELSQGYYVYSNDTTVYDMRLMMVSSAGEDQTPIEKFVDDIYYELDLKAPNTNKKQKKVAVNNVITNVLTSTQQGKVVALPRGRRKYTNSTFYGFDYCTTTFVVGAVEALKRCGYIAYRRGFNDRERKKGEVSRVWATNKLLNELNDYTSIPLAFYEEEEEPCRIHYLFGVKLNRRNHTNPIVLKDSDKNLLSYEPSKRIITMQKFLNHYNDFIKKNTISIPKEVYDAQLINSINPTHQTASNVPECKERPSISLPLLGRSGVNCIYYIELNCRFYRVFNNGKFTERGRFYGAEYQSLNERQRKEILIDNEKTCEVDYSAFHARMLYHLDGIECKEDPYRMVNSEEELRLLIKKMMQIIINAKSRGEAVGAFNEYLQDKPELFDILSDHKLDAWKLSDMVIQAHKKIQKYFNTCIGVKLQYKDSKIAERILKHFTRKKIVCLCIHDSFIVQEQFKNELIEVMRREYKREMGFDCKLKVNG